MPVSQTPSPRCRATASRARRIGAGVLVAALALAGCGSAGSGSAASSSSLSAMTGKQIFQTQGCAGCHTLSAAGANGTVGPNLDNLKPTDVAVVKQVTNGGGGMPSFRGQLTRAEIAKVARFVSTATR